jgi:hypothetical protein
MDLSKYEDGMGCEACEAMCLDAVDETLTPAEQAVFDRHIAGCVSCAEQLSEARRGAAWMEMLKGHRPEPPAGMLQRILAQTSEAEMSRVFPRHGAVPTPRFEVVPVEGYREKLWFKIERAFGFNVQHTHFQPRMAMTAAMAFFSIALTLNLGGVRLQDLKPGSIQRTVSEARASMAREIRGMKVVYQVESRVNELRDEDERAGHDAGGPFGPGKAAAPKVAPSSKPAPQESKPRETATPKRTSELLLPSPELQRGLPDFKEQGAVVEQDSSAGKQDSKQQTAPGADASQMQRGA